MGRVMPEEKASVSRLCALGTVSALFSNEGMALLAAEATRNCSCPASVAGDGTSNTAKRGRDNARHDVSDLFTRPNGKISF